MTDPFLRFRLDGRTALITGASRNIGKAMARAFAEAGADLVLVARTQAPLAAVADEVGAATGRTVTGHVCDVGSPDDVARLVAVLHDEASNVDVLVNNAFANPGAGRSVLAADDDEWQQAFDVNLFGPLRLCRALVPTMLTAGRGVIVNVLSGAAFTPIPSMGPYNASKAALWMLTRTLAQELAPTVRVNALCPGSMRDEHDSRPMTQAFIDATPLARAAVAEEAVGAALYLASDASSYSTGDVVFVNGGVTSLSSFPNPGGGRDGG